MSDLYHFLEMLMHQGYAKVPCYGVFATDVSLTALNDAMKEIALVQQNMRNGAPGMGHGYYTVANGANPVELQIK